MRVGHLIRCLVLVMVFLQWKPGSLLLWTLRRFFSGTGGDQLHVMVADVIKSFDTVDRSILDCALGRLGLPDWFRKVYFSFHRDGGRYLAYCPDEEPKIYRMMDFISGGAHGPVHLLLMSAAELGFAWDGAEKGWVRVCLPPLGMMSGPVQHFRSAILDAWRFRIFSRLSERKGFLGGEYADFQGSLQLLTSSHLRERDKMLLKAILCGRVWNRFLHGKTKKEDVPCRFCGQRHGDGQLFWECTLPTLQHVREVPEFATLMSLDRGKWPRCLLCHGWLLGLSSLAKGILGPLLLVTWLSDGSREDFSSVGGFEVGGAGVYLPASGVASDSSIW